MERFGRITFSDKVYESVPGEPVEYSFVHEYSLEIEFTENYIFDGDEFKGVDPILNVSARHSKVYQRSGKVLSEDLVDDYIEFVIADPGQNRIHNVLAELATYDVTWTHKFMELM